MPAANPLLVVDVQLGFVNDYTNHIPGRIATLLQQRSYAPVLFTRFINEAGGPYHRFLDWHDCEGPPETDLAPEIAPLAAPEFIFAKPGYAGISDELAGFLLENTFEQVSIAGIDTDMCVLKVAMDIFDLGIRPIVLADCCASTAGLQAHLAGLAILARNIGASQLQDTGLGTGQLGAPEH